MLEVLLLQKTDVPDGELVALGPSGGILNRTLRVPLTFTRNAFLSSRKLKMTLACELIEGKYEVKSVKVESPGGFVSTRDLTQLGIPRVIRGLAPDLVPDFELWTADGMRNQESFEALKSDYVYLAQMYWLHSAVHGKPRIEITKALGVSKSTSNVLLRRIAEEIPLPRDTSPKSDALVDA